MDSRRFRETEGGGEAVIWPWSEIAKWKRLAEHHDGRAIQAQARVELYRAEYLNLALAIRGAHKGIWRLKQKIKRLEAKP